MYARKLIPIEGKKFGRLIALSVHSKTTKGRYKILCICECGKELITNKASLLSGATTSCGCFRKEQVAKKLKQNATYLWKTTTYKSWSHLKDRCLNPKCKCFAYYGGRGITVCERWMKFKNFFEDMGLKPSKFHSIDRINNDGNYEPGNCRWATCKEQARNSRHNTVVEFEDKSLCLSEWAEVTGISRQALGYRNKHNWNKQKMMTQPCDPSVAWFKKGRKRVMKKAV